MQQERQEKKLSIVIKSMMMRMAVNFIWLANTFYICYTVYNQKVDGELHDCVPLTGYTRPIMVPTNYLLWLPRDTINKELDINPDSDYYNSLFDIELKKYVYSFSAVLCSLCLLSLIAHSWLLLADLVFVLDQRKYIETDDINIGQNLKLKKKGCRSSIFNCFSKSIKILPVVEPAVIITETIQVIGFRGSVCRGSYKAGFEFEFITNCVLNEIDLETCEKNYQENFGGDKYQYLSDLGNWYYYTVFAKCTYFVTCIALIRFYKR